jgi:hypothetical protein
LAVLGGSGFIRVLVCPTFRRPRSDWGTVWTGEQMLSQAQVSQDLQVCEPSGEMCGLRDPYARGISLSRDHGRANLGVAFA